MTMSLVSGAALSAEHAEEAAAMEFDSEDLKSDIVNSHNAEEGGYYGE